MIPIKLSPYPAYGPSSIAWLGDVPAHWEVRRLRNVAEMRVSTVDKHVNENEMPVRLCNYVDVYKNDYINAQLDFMQATATGEEIERFRLEKDDVLITKDSETWDDIGVPALVTEATPDLISGYHLALLRPRFDKLEGAYLLRALQSKGLAYQFHIEAKGVTRYGLSHAGIRSVWFPLPTLPEQTAIARFLDHADRRIRRYIRAKQKLITLLKEQKQAIIHQAVTGQIDVRTGLPYPAYKPSGAEWLGDVPAHWKATSLGQLLIQRKEKNDPIKTTNILSLSLKAGVIPYAEKEAGGNKAKEDLSAYMLAYPGDIVVNSMNVVVGSVGLSKYFGAVSPLYYMLRPRHETADLVEYFDRIFQNVGFQRSLFGIGNGIMYIQSKSSGKLNTIRLRIPMTKLKKVTLPGPPDAEQAYITKHLDEISANIDSAIAHTERNVDLLTEYRARLIADVVTGKLDVREAAAALPEVDPLAVEDDLDETSAAADESKFDNEELAEDAD